MAGRYKSKEFCWCGEKTIPHRNLCLIHHRKTAAIAAKKHRIMKKKGLTKTYSRSNT